MELKLYNRKGALKLTVSPSDNSTRQKRLMADHVLALSFTAFEYVPLEVYDYVDFEGVRFWVMEEYAPKQISTVEWEYECKFYGIESLTKQALVLKLADGENNPIFSLTAPAREHMALIVANINRQMGTTDWKVGEVVATENLTLDYEGTYCDEALSMLADAAKTEFWADGMTLNLCRCEYGEEVVLGYENGLLDLERDTANNVKFFTRLFPIGSTRNIDPKEYGYSRLQLPSRKAYVEQNTQLGIVEHYEQEAFSTIYPHRVGTLSAVRSELKTGEDGKPFTIYHVKDTSLTFDPNSYEIGGLVKQMTFQSGELNSWDFEVNYDSKRKEFEIITQWPYDDDTQLPGGMLVPKVGDEYILWNIRMPREYYALAEQEFAEAVDNYLRAHDQDRYVYKGHTDYIEMAQRRLSLDVGQRVRLESDEYFPGVGYRTSRITSITQNVQSPLDMDIEVSDVLGKGALEKINDELGEVEHDIRIAMASFPDIIRSWEGTPASDTTVYSSRKSEREFLNKRKGGTVEGSVVFNNGLSSSDYRPGGFSGAGFRIGRDANGDSVAEFDKLTVRKEAVFNELVINQTTFRVGATVFSNGGCELTGVDERTAVYRCFYDNKEGRRYSGLVAGDQVRCQRYDTKQKTIVKYYWRLVVSTGEDYVDLSINDADGAGIPEAGDEIAQFGNRTDRTRQSALVIDPLNGGSIEVFAGIDSFNLTAKNYVGIGVNSSTGRAYSYAYGDMFFGDRDFSDPNATFITFQQKEGEDRPRVHIQADVTIGGGSSGLRNLSEWNTAQLQIDQAGKAAENAEQTANTAQEAADEAARKAQEAKDYINNTLPEELAEVNRKLDGVVESWYYAYSPTLENKPTVSWIRDGKQSQHLGDTFSNTQPLYFVSKDSSEWEQGGSHGLSSQTWDQNKNPDSTRVRTPEMLGVVGKISIRMRSGLVQAYYANEPQGKIMGSSGWVAELEIDGAEYPCVAFAVKISDTVEIVPGDAVGLLVFSGGTLTHPDAGKAWRWVESGSSYKWTPIADNDAVLALQKAAAAQDTADGKRRTFVVQPAPPYNVGDLWTQGPAGDMMRCVKSRLTGSFDVSDWDKASKYTDDTVAQEAKRDAQAAATTLTTWASDSYISPQEKTALRQQRKDIQAEYGEITAQAAKYAVPTAAFTSAYDAADKALAKYTAATPESIPVEADYAQIAAYYTSRGVILDAIAAAAKAYSEKLVNDLQISSVNRIADEYLLRWNDTAPGITTEGSDEDGHYFKIDYAKLYHAVGGGDRFLSIFPELQFEAGRQYGFKIRWKNPQDSPAMAFRIDYTDGTKDQVDLYTVFQKVTVGQVVTRAGKTVQKISVSYFESGYAYIYAICLVEGNKLPQDWPVSPIDVQSRIDTAKRTAQAAQETADTAQQTAQAAATTLTTWASDSYISPQEKTALRQQRKDIQAEYDEIKAQAAKYAVPTETFASAYSAAEKALAKYTAAAPESIPVEADYAQIAAYYTARGVILDAIAAAAKAYSEKLVDEVQPVGDNLLTHTKNFTEGWIGAAQTAGEALGGLTVYTATATQANIDMRQQNTITLLPSTVYTLSFWAKGRGTLATFVYPSVNEEITATNGNNAGYKGRDTFNSYTMTADWKRFWVTFRTFAEAKTGNVLFRVMKGGEASVCGAKLAQGNKGIVWTESPEDLDEKIEAAKIAADNLEYLKTAFADDDTIISGGVVVGSFIGVKTSEKVVFAGMSGKNFLTGQDFIKDDMSCPWLFGGATSATEANSAVTRFYANGKFYSADAIITGEITATSGTFGDFKIDGLYLESSHALDHGTRLGDGVVYNWNGADSTTLFATGATLEGMLPIGFTSAAAQFVAKFTREIPYDAKVAYYAHMTRSAAGSPMYSFLANGGDIETVDGVIQGHIHPRTVEIKSTVFTIGGYLYGKEQLFLIKGSASNLTNIQLPSTSGGNVRLGETYFFLQCSGSGTRISPFKGSGVKIKDENGGVLSQYVLEENKRIGMVWDGEYWRTLS